MFFFPRIALGLLALLTAIAGPKPAVAVVCSISGYVRLQPADQYYCDATPTGSVQDCANWTEVDLDTAVKPLKYIRLDLRTASGTYLGFAITDYNGYYSTSVVLQGADCTGQTLVANVVFRRIHEGDIGSPTPRYRLRLRPYSSNSTWAAATQKTLTGPSTQHDILFQRNGGTASRIADLYYTTNSAVSQIILWTSNLDAAFGTTYGTLEMLFETGYNATSWADFPNWGVHLNENDVNKGAVIRHEVGHLVYATMLRGNRAGNCVSYAYNNAASHGGESCEWGETATGEGVAHFIATRSITYSDENAWLCTCFDPANQDICSEVAVGVLEDDRNQVCSNGSGRFSGIGDTYASTQNHCTQLKRTGGNGCLCPGFENGNYCSSLWSMLGGGFRNEVQVARFLWDLIDTHNEGADLTDLSMGGVGGLASIFEGMACDSNAGYGVDGTCNEPSRANDADCIPNPPTDAEVTPHQGTRDSLNVFDIADVVPGDQTGIRTVNCVQGAGD